MARKTEFNKEEILDIITDHFWEHGFHNTSMSSLVERTGIQKASLYAAFGNKDSMFKKSIEVYSKRTKPINKKGIVFIELFLKRILNESKGKGLKNGCLIMNSVLELSCNEDENLALSKSHWEEVRLNFKKHIDYALENNEIDKSVNSEKLSKWVITQAFTIREFSKITDDPQYFKQISDTISMYLDNIKLKETVCH